MLFNKFKMTALILFVLQLCHPVTAHAEYGGNGAVSGSVNGGISISTSSIGFDDHRGMKAYINGQDVFCIQRGYPFRSRVSELQMVNTSVQSMSGSTHDGTMASLVRYLLESVDQSGGGTALEYFRGWGAWTINNDHTDAVQTSTSGAPSSLAWNESFDEDSEDDEDSPYENRYQGSGGVRKWTEEVKNLMTGHEGSVGPFATQMKKISYAEVGFTTSQLYAQAMLHYYIYEDPDSSGYSSNTKYQCEQAMEWGVQYGFISTVGGNGRYLRVMYKDSSGDYGVSRNRHYTGSCDGYIKTTIGGQYDAMKLYRQVVWKTINMRMRPSFSYGIDDIENAEPIKLYWDEEQGLYTATVSDANGVLKYFDFEIPGVTCTDNGDGTLTISSAEALGGTLTSLPKASRLEPSDGIFKLPSYYRWELEGKTVRYTYTALKPLTLGFENIVQEANNGAGPGRVTIPGREYQHSLTWGCNWYCTNGEDTEVHCTHAPNNCDNEPNNCSHNCNQDCAGGELNCNEDHIHWYACYSDKYCGHQHDASCHSHEKEADKCHVHVDANGTGCYHKNYCSYYAKERAVGTKTFVNGTPQSDCITEWCCGKEHFDTVQKTVSGKYIDWQDLTGVYAEGNKLIDPTYAYIKVETVPHEFPAETDTEVLLIADNDEWNDLTYTMPNGQIVKHASHLRVGEKFHLRYIYSYTGASKGFRIESSVNNKPYYQYNYLARMQAPQNATPIYNLRSGLSGDRFLKSSIGVPYARLVIEKTPITIRGIYTTPETAYTLNGTYTYDSGSDWNDSIYLDALTTDIYDDGYSNKSADQIATSNSSSELTSFTVTKQDDRMQVVWVYDAEPEVFTSALVYATAYIQVGDDENETKNYYDEAYNYAADQMWMYNFEDHNNVGGVGYFSSGQTGEQIPSHTVYTQNNEYLTYAVRNKVWQSDIDVKVSNFVQNTGAGITEHIYQDRDRDNHDLNYNLYYTIDVENPKATLYEDKIKAHDGKNENQNQTYNYNTTSDVYEFDVNNLISWGSTGDSQTVASYGTTTVVDHIKTGRTYIQREIPTVLNTMTANQTETMTFSIYPNHDRLVYEDYYSGVGVSGSGVNRKVSATAKDSCYPANRQTASSEIYAAMNPNLEDMRPQNINGADNVPDEYNQSDAELHHMSPATSFTLKLSNGETKTIFDSNTKTYTQYAFEYNGGNRNNKVIFDKYRKSAMFFKYSKTNYSYNGKDVQSAVGEFRNAEKTQTESYYISQVLFKSNYTSKYKKELEAQGADYIEDFDAYGNLKDAWIDMVNQNKFAIVAAGQGFELKVTVKYENSLLTQYLARYFGTDDAQNDILGSSNRVQKRDNEIPANSRQYANISALTGKDGRTVPYYKDTERAYISSYNVIDRLAVNLVTGSNVFKDLYCFMSDNPDTVYSYSGIYDTPVVFDRDIKYSEDYSVTTVTYTMCVSHENGIANNLQKMKFYTNQLVPDKTSPGVVEGGYDVASKGEHSITLWTPVVAATPFDYPDTMQDRYIGDAIELGYTIKTTGADDSIVHIVQ